MVRLGKKSALSGDALHRHQGHASIDERFLVTKSFPESWEGQPAFREIFLVHLPPDLAEYCQELGEHYFTVLLEANMSDADPDDLVRGVAADLYHACLVLNALLDYDQLDLEDRLPGWRDRVCQVADEMKAMTERQAH